MAYALTNSVDGVARMTVNIDARLTLNDLARVIAADRFNDITDHCERRDGTVSLSELRRRVKAQVSNKKAAIKIVSDYIYDFGFSNVGYVIGDNNLDSVVVLDGPDRVNLVSIIEKHLENLWAK